MKQLFLVSDQKGVIQACATFKEGKDKFDQMCANHIKVMSDNSSFNYKRYQTKVDGSKAYYFRAYHKSIVKGKIRFNNDLFSFQVINLPE